MTGKCLLGFTATTRFQMLQKANFKILWFYAGRVIKIIKSMFLQYQRARMRPSQFCK